VSRRKTIILLTSLLIVYVSSFLAFRAFPLTFDLVPSQDPGHYLVFFSRNTDVHCALRIVYWPLIATIPGHRHYLNRTEHRQLMNVFKLESEDKSVISEIPDDE
jgi:hypothetical protein